MKEYFKKFEFDSGTLYLGFAKPEYFIPNKERKQWVRALKSGKYKKGAGLLRRANNTYCCLGVKLDLERISWKESYYNTHYYYCVDGFNEVKSYYSGNCKAISPVGKFPNGTYFKSKNLNCESLSEINDSLGEEQKHFNTIAEVIDIIWDRKTWGDAV